MPRRSPRLQQPTARERQCEPTQHRIERLIPDALGERPDGCGSTCVRALCFLGGQAECAPCAATAAKAQPPYSAAKRSDACILTWLRPEVDGPARLAAATDRPVMLKREALRDVAGRAGWASSCSARG